MKLDLLILRGPPRKFVHAAAHAFVPNHKFDVIVFSDVLYYVEHEKVLKQYSNYLNPNGILWLLLIIIIYVTIVTIILGIVIISIFHQTEKLMYEHIFNFAKSIFQHIDEIDVGGIHNMHYASLSVYKLVLSWCAYVSQAYMYMHVVYSISSIVSIYVVM